MISLTDAGCCSRDDRLFSVASPVYTSSHTPREVSTRFCRSYVTRHSVETTPTPHSKCVDRGWGGGLAGEGDRGTDTADRYRKDENITRVDDRVSDHWDYG